MPTVFEIYGYRFFFYSNENNEPIHIHVTKGDSTAKIWLIPVISEEYSYGFKVKDRKEIIKLVQKNSTLIIEKWNEYFK